ncbi:MAG: LacI family DNA-binding transcriptional regulator [Bacilli bacterium]
MYDAITDHESPSENAYSWPQHATIMASGIQDILIGTDLHLRVLSMPSFLHSASDSEIKTWLDQSGDLQASEGLILTNPIIHDSLAEFIVRSKLPCVVVGKCPIPLPIPQIDIDNIEGTRLITMHVLALGHTDAAFLGPDVDLTVLQDRLQGFKEAFEQNGTPLSRNYWLKTRSTDFAFSFREARTRVLEAIDADTVPSAIVAFNDEMAYGAIQALTSRGLRVPQDVSVAGFDDLPSAMMYSPPLTTIHQDTRHIGRYACRSLLRQLRGETAPSLTVLPVQLVIRESTKSK